MKRFFLILMLMGSLTLRAEEPVKVKTLLKNAKTAVKDSKDQEKNQKALLEAMGRDDVNDEDRAAFYYWCAELSRSQNATENLKVYLGQQYDTLSFFSTILQMNQYLLQCDSVEQLTGKYKWRDKSVNLIRQYRPNLLNGGKYLLKRGNAGDAFNYFDICLRLPDEPMFQPYLDMRTDENLPKIAYWASISGYNNKQPRQALKYMDFAIAGADSALRVSLYEYKALCLKQVADTSAFVAVLRHGVEHYPRHDFFYLNMMDYYLFADSTRQGIALSDSMLQQQGQRAIYWYGKCQMYQKNSDWEHVAECADRTLTLDSTFVDAYYYKGIAHLNQAIDFSKTMTGDVRSARAKRDRVKLRAMYQNARVPLEKLRQMRPEEKQRWGVPLYTIYLNLNLGTEFSEIEKLLNAD